jgi:hypothetical protein
MHRAAVRMRLQLHSVLGNLSLSLSASQLVAVIATWALWPLVPHAHLLIWMVSIGLLVTVRLYHCWHIRGQLRTDQPGYARTCAGSAPDVSPPVCYGGC